MHNCLLSQVRYTRLKTTFRAKINPVLYLVVMRKPRDYHNPLLYRLYTGGGDKNSTQERRYDHLKSLSYNSLGLSTRIFYSSRECSGGIDEKTNNKELKPFNSANAAM